MIAHDRTWMVAAAIALAPVSASAQTYSYDNLGRVTAVVQPNGTKTIYYYDGVDNRTATATATSGSPSVTPPTRPATVILVTSMGSLRSLVDGMGFTVSATSNFLFVVPADVTLIATSPSTPPITSGTWPAGATIELQIYGKVYGGGGAGGNGTCSATPGTAGAVGGDAVSANANMTVTAMSGSAVNGGGGGGGGGGWASVMGGGSCGSGGGGGYPNGAGGLGVASPPSGFTATGNGAPGTVSGGGAAGSPGVSGGVGGAANTAGAQGAGGTANNPGAGGVKGYAVKRNGWSVTVTGIPAGNIG